MLLLLYLVLFIVVHIVLVIFYILFYSLYSAYLSEVEEHTRAVHASSHGRRVRQGNNSDRKGGRVQRSGTGVIWSGTQITPLSEPCRYASVRACLIPTALGSAVLSIYRPIFIRCRVCYFVFVYVVKVSFIQLNLIAYVITPCIATICAPVISRLVIVITILSPLYSFLFKVLISSIL